LDGATPDERDHPADQDERAGRRRALPAWPPTSSSTSRATRDFFLIQPLSWLAEEETKIAIRPKETQADAGVPDGRNSAHDGFSCVPVVVLPASS